MGSRIIAINNLCNQYRKLCLSSSLESCRQIYKSSQLNSQMQLVPFTPFLNSWRISHSFFSRLTAQQLWKGVTSVSNAGRKKGRGKGSSRRVAKDLNKGQVIGFGKINMVWPGFNAPVVQGREVIRQKELPPDPEREKRILEIRDKMTARKRLQIHPLERGWSGTKLPGRSLGPPDPVGDETFEGFDSRVLQFKVIHHMDGQRGRVRNLSAIVVVGNKNGLAGFSEAKNVNGMSAANLAKNKAAKRLRYIERDGDTVVHDFFTQFWATKIFVEKRPPGHGLVCHRAIKAVCELLGIKDLYAKVEGPTKALNLTRAFFIGLMKQKSLKQIADEKGLHIVQLQKERDNFPILVASPDHCRTEVDIGPTERTDFFLHLHGGKVPEERKKYQPFYANFPSYIKEMKDREKLRNHRDVRIHLLAKYGELKSYIQIREEEKAKLKVKEAVEG